jgi:creatinine amidohydrolase
MAARPYVLSDITWQHASDTAYGAAILPWGAMEAHNIHLPYGTDVIECDAVAAESARIAWNDGARVIVLPTVPFGVNTGQLDIPLTLNINPTTQLAILSDLIDALEQQGINKLVILNGHGGNDFRQIIRELQPSHGVFLCTLNWWQAIDAKSYFDAPGDHAGELETSVMMHIASSLVQPLETAGPGVTRAPRLTAMREGWVWAPRPWTRVSDDTGSGDPRGAAPAKGERFFTDVTARIASFLVELCALDPTRLYDPS